MEIFEDDMKSLPQELRWTLANDLVAAFRNRLAVLQRIQAKQTSERTWKSAETNTEPLETLHIEEELSIKKT